MSTLRELTGPNWYVIQTHPRQEGRAEHNLKAWAVETFNIRIKEAHRNPYTGEKRYLIKPLFPQYIFARFDVQSLLNKICYTRGVRTVVSFGGGPTPVADEVIELLRSYVGAEDGIVRDEKLRTGDKLLIRDGAFKGLIGIFERELKASDRVIILLATISYQGRLVIERELIERVSERVHDSQKSAVQQQISW